MKEIVEPIFIHGMQIGHQQTVIDQSSSNIRQLLLGCMIWANEHHGVWPTSLDQLAPLYPTKGLDAIIVDPGATAPSALRLCAAAGQRPLQHHGDPRERQRQGSGHRRFCRRQYGCHELGRLSSTVSSGDQSGFARRIVGRGGDAADAVALSMPMQPSPDRPPRTPPRTRRQN